MVTISNTFHGLYRTVNMRSEQACRSPTVHLCGAAKKAEKHHPPDANKVELNPGCYCTTFRL